MRRIPGQALATVAACGALWIALGSQIVPGARKHDFLNLYTGASLALEGDFARLHDPEVQLARERRYVPDLPNLVPFVRPHFYAAVLAPLALIPFGPAFWVWVGIQTGLLIGCWCWAFLRWGADAMIFGALFLPTALGIAHGQDCVLMLIIAIASYELHERGRPGLSGVALGLGLIKFHLWLLWPVMMIGQRRWRMLAGYAAAVAVEVLASWGLGGSAGLLRYVALLGNKDIEHLNPSPELTISVHGLAANLGPAGWWLTAALILAVVAPFGLSLRKAPAWRTWASTSAGSLLVAPHVYGYDAGLLLLGVWLAIFCTKDWSPRIAATALATPIPFLMTLAGSPWAATTPLVLLAFLFTLALNQLKHDADYSKEVRVGVHSGADAAN